MMIRRILRILRNKYLLVIIVFLVLILFVNKNNIVTHIDLHRTLSRLKADKQYYLKEIEKDSIAMEELMTNPKNLEKFAREKYLMKKDDEDVFVIVNKSE